MTDIRTLTQAELMTEATQRFGSDTLDFAFQCTRCGDIATLREFREAGDIDMSGQGCIGRLIVGADGKPERGCDWAAFGLIPGPWTIVFPDGRKARSFPLAPAKVTEAAEVPS